jgi:hypothetical protein
MVSDLGRCLTGMAQQEVRLAYESLGKVDPEDSKTIRALQNKVWLGEQFEGWIRELIDNGRNALEAHRHGTTE